MHRLNTQPIPAIFVCAVVVTACTSPFQREYPLTFEAQDEKLYDIDAFRAAEHSRSAPVTIEEATADVDLLQIDRPARPARVDLSIEDSRAAAMSNNLDLKVRLLDPTIAATSVDEEEAKFDSTFSTSFLNNRSDSPTAVGTEGSMSEFRSLSTGLAIPLRTGGSVSLDVPLTKTDTNNPFSLLNPAYTADASVSISQPLLRNAGQRVNTHSIRAARQQTSISAAQTKLETIRILANADRAYWRLYAAQRELEVRLQQYELARAQLERAQRRVQAGDAAEIEIIRAEAGVARQIEAIIVSDTSVRQNERTLKQVLNRDDLPVDDDTPINLVTAPDPLGLDLDPEALARYAVDNRMDMLEQELQLALDLSTIDLQRNQTLPLLTLDYTYTINGLGGSFNRAFDQIPDHSFEDHRIGLRAEIPVTNDAAEARLNRAILQRIQRLATRDQRRLSIETEVYDVVDQIRQNWQRILAARQEAMLAGRELAGEQRQNAIGERTITDVLDAAARLADAQSREISALVDYQISQIDLAFATGTLLGYQKIRWAPTMPEGAELDAASEWAEMD